MEIARAEYIESKTAFMETIVEMRRVNPVDAGFILRLALDECNRAFEIFNQAERAYTAFAIADEVPMPYRAA